MLTIEQMTANATPYKTSVGADYLLPRLSNRTRRAALEFVSAIVQMESVTTDLGDPKVAMVVLDEMTKFLLVWLNKVNPGITAEQIEEEWDIADIPGLMKVIRANEKEVQDILPPVLPEGTPAEQATGETSPAPSASDSPPTD